MHNQVRHLDYSYNACPIVLITKKSLFLPLSAGQKFFRKLEREAKFVKIVSVISRRICFSSLIKINVL